MQKKLQNSRNDSVAVRSEKKGVRVLVSFLPFAAHVCLKIEKYMCDTCATYLYCDKNKEKREINKSEKKNKVKR